MFLQENMNLRPIEERGRHGAGLRRVVVDGLLADQDEVRLVLDGKRLEQLGNRDRLDGVVRLAPQHEQCPRPKKKAGVH